MYNKKLSVQKYETVDRYENVQYALQIVLKLYINMEDKWTLYGCIFNIPFQNKIPKVMEYVYGKLLMQVVSVKKI